LCVNSSQSEADGDSHLRHNLAHVIRVETPGVNLDLAKRVKDLDGDFEAAGQILREPREF
jgi:hypothetical protein